MIQALSGHLHGPRGKGIFKLPLDMCIEVSCEDMARRYSTVERTMDNIDRPKVTTDRPKVNTDRPKVKVPPCLPVLLIPYSSHRLE